MRIIAGKYRGKKLFSPTSDGIRPTADRAREAVFNILASKIGNDWENFEVIDIFAGTGALGLEALSRGSKTVSLLDADTKTAAKNVKLFEKEKINIIKAEVENLPKTSQKYSMFFMDAPYGKGLSEIALCELIKKDYLAQNAIGIVEVEKKEKISIPKDFEVIDERIYGIAKVYFLKFAKS